MCTTWNNNLAHTQGWAHTTLETTATDHQSCCCIVLFLFHPSGQTISNICCSILYMPWALTIVCVSHVWLFVTLQTVAPQALLSMGFPRQEFWRGLQFPSPWNLPNPEIKLRSPALQADSLPSDPSGSRLSINIVSPFFHLLEYVSKLWSSMSFLFSVNLQIYYF